MLAFVIFSFLKRSFYVILTKNAFFQKQFYEKNTFEKNEF